MAALANSYRAPGVPGPEGSLSCPTSLGLHTSSPGSCSSSSDPAARSRGLASPQSSPFSTTGPGRSPTAPRLRYLRLQRPCVLGVLILTPGPRDRQDRETPPRPSSAATVLTTRDSLAERRGPRAHTPPARPSGHWLALPRRVPRRLAAWPPAYWLADLSLRSSSYFRLIPPFPVGRERREARAAEAAVHGKLRTRL